MNSKARCPWNSDRLWKAALSKTGVTYFDLCLHWLWTKIIACVILQLSIRWTFAIPILFIRTYRFFYMPQYLWLVGIYMCKCLCLKILRALLGIYHWDRSGLKLHGWSLIIFRCFVLSTPLVIFSLTKNWPKWGHHFLLDIFEFLFFVT